MKQMTLKDYQERTMRTAKDVTNMTISHQAAREIYFAFIEASAVGESADKVKKSVFHGHGDIDWPRDLTLPGIHIDVEALTPQQLMLMDGALGCIDETAEVTDLIREHIFEKQPLDKEHLVKEIGDKLWYLALLAKAIGTDLSVIGEKNIEKLNKRYPEGFDSAKSIKRAKGDI